MGGRVRGLRVKGAVQTQYFGTLTKSRCPLVRRRLCLLIAHGIGAKRGRLFHGRKWEGTLEWLPFIRQESGYLWKEFTLRRLLRVKPQMHKEQRSRNQKRFHRRDAENAEK